MGRPLDPSPKPVTVIQPDPDFVSIVFDRDIQDVEELGEGPWFVRLGGFKRTVVARDRLATREVQLSLFGATPDAGDDVCTYTPPPADVIGTNGYAAAAFELPIPYPPEEE